MTVVEKMRWEWKRQADLLPRGMGIHADSAVDLLRQGADLIEEASRELNNLMDSLDDHIIKEESERLAIYQAFSQVLQRLQV